MTPLILTGARNRESGRFHSFALNFPHSTSVCLCVCVCGAKKTRDHVKQENIFTGVYFQGLWGGRDVFCTFTPCLFLACGIPDCKETLLNNPLQIQYCWHVQPETKLKKKIKSQQQHRQTGKLQALCVVVYALCIYAGIKEMDDRVRSCQSPLAADMPQKCLQQS